MSIVYWGFEVLACVIDSYILMYFIEHFVSENKKSEKIVQGRIIFFILMTLVGVVSINKGTFYEEFTIGAIFIIYLTYGFLYTKENKKDIFIASAIIYILLGLVNMLVPLGINLLTGIPISLMLNTGDGSVRIIAVLICKIIYYFAIISILHFLKRSSNRLNKREWIMMSGSFLIILMIAVVLFVILRVQPFDEGVAVLILVVDLGLFAILVALYIMLLQLNSAHEKELEYECIMINQKNQKKELEDREKEYEQMQIVRHDIKNYFLITLGILQKGKKEEAIEYLNTLLKEKIETVWEVVDVGDTTLNSVINTKFTMCKKKGISCETAFIGLLKYKNPINLGIIMSNLLDNAMEACEKVTGKTPRIVISCTNQKGYLNICIKNTIAEPVLEKNPLLKTTKQEKTLHGYGLKSIKKLLDEEDGMISQYEKNGWFITHIFLPDVFEENVK